MAQVVTDLLLQRPRLNPRLVHVVFVVNRMPLRLTFLEGLKFSLVSVSPLPHTDLSQWLYNLSN
jgi:hypothetical protein